MALKFMWQALNSNFAIALIAAAAGAFFGAWGAQRIAERSKRREELLRELRNTNVAIVLATTTCNAAVAVKKQQVRPWYEKFKQDKEAFRTFVEQRKTGQVQGDAQYYFQADLTLFGPPETPIATLKQLVFYEISAYGRALGLVSALDQSILRLRRAISKRNELIQQFKDRGGSRASDFPARYFGMPISGFTDREYSDVADAIRSYLDDIVFFSSRLCEDLVLHGNEVRERFVKPGAKDVPNVTNVDFSQARADGLIPTDAQYQDWLNGFVKRELGGKDSVSDRE
jgi:hypothetical protein